MPGLAALPRIAIRNILFALILCAASVTIQSDALAQTWSTMAHDAQRTGRADAVGPAYPNLEWQFNSDDYGQVGPVISRDGVIYAPGEYNQLAALNPDGTKRWSFDRGWMDTTPALGSDGTLYAVTDGKLVAISPGGEKLWEFQYAGSSPLVGPDGTVYVGGDSFSHNLIAVTPEGTQKWAFPFDGDATLVSFAIAPDGTIYASATDGWIYVINSDGALRTQYPGFCYGTCISIDPDGTAYTTRPAEDDTADICAIAPDGSEKWIYHTGGYSGSMAIGPDGTLYVPATDNSSVWLAAVSRDGVDRWRVPLDGYFRTAPVVDANGTVYVGTDYNTLNAVSSEGTIKWQYQADYYLTSVAMGSDGTLYLSGSYRLEAIGPGQTPAPPSVSISQPSSSGTVSGPVTYKISYGNAEQITLGPANVQLITTGTACGTVTISGEGNTERTVEISAITGDGTIAISLADGTASNAAGEALASGTTKAFEVCSERIEPGDWRMLAHDAQHSGRSSYAGPNLPALLWELDIHDFGGYSNGPVFDSKGTLYLGSASVNPDGTVRKTYDDCYGSSIAIGPAGTLLAAEPMGGLLSLSAGGQVWSRMDNLTVTTGPVTDAAGNVYIGADNQRLCAIGADGRVKWEFSTDGDVQNDPAVSQDGVVYVVTSNRLYAVGADGVERWHYGLSRSGSDWITAPPAIDANGTVYFSTSHGMLYAINPNGTRKWVFDAFLDIRYWPAFGPDGTAYIECRDELLALDQSGRQKWCFYLHATSGGPPISVDSAGVVYAASEDGILYAVNPDGSVKWALPTGPMSSPPIVGPNGILYVWSSNGKLEAYGEDASTTPPSISVEGPSPYGNGALYTVKYQHAAAISLRADDIKLNTTGTARGQAMVEYVDQGTCQVSIVYVSGSGTIGISISAGTARNAAGAAPAVGPSEVFPVSSVPSAQISAPSVSYTDKGPVTYTVTYQDADVVTLGLQDVSLYRSGTATGVISVSGSGNTSRTITISHISGEGWLGIQVGRYTAYNDIGFAESIGGSGWFGVTGGPPIAYIYGASDFFTTGQPVTYSVGYLGADSVTLSAVDVKLNRTGTADGVVSVAGQWVTISDCTGDGTLGISIRSGTARNVHGKASACGPSDVFHVLAGPPSGVISLPSVAATSNGPVSYTVTFSHGSWGYLTAADVILNKTGTADGTVAVTALDERRYAITISSITGAGSLGISLPEGAAENGLGLSPSIGPSATFAVVDTPPTPEISAPSTSSTRNGPVSYTVTCANADAVGLTARNVHLIKTGTATGTISVSGSGTSSRTVTISKIKGKGTLGISIDAGTARNAAGSAPAAGPSATFTVSSK